MSNVILEAALFAAAQLIKHAPELFVGFQDIITRKGVTHEELVAERNRLASLSYESLVPNSKLDK